MVEVIGLHGANVDSPYLNLAFLDILTKSINTQLCNILITITYLIVLANDRAY